MSMCLRPVHMTCLLNRPAPVYPKTDHLIWLWLAWKWTLLAPESIYLHNLLALSERATSRHQYSITKKQFADLPIWHLQPEYISTRPLYKARVCFITPRLSVRRHWNLNSCEQFRWGKRHHFTLWKIPHVSCYNIAGMNPLCSNTLNRIFKVCPLPR